MSEKSLPWLLCPEETPIHVEVPVQTVDSAEGVQTYESIKHCIVHLVKVCGIKSEEDGATLHTHAREIFSCIL